MNIMIFGIKKNSPYGFAHFSNLDLAEIFKNEPNHGGDTGEPFEIFEFFAFQI